MAKKRNLDKEVLRSISTATYFSEQEFKNRIERSKLAEADSLKDKRLEERQCKFCFYFRNHKVLAGQAFTFRNCELCRSEMIFATTHTNKICFLCSDKYEICAYCMSEMNPSRVKVSNKGKRKSKS